MRFELFICIHAAWANKQSKSKASGKTERVIPGNQVDNDSDRESHVKAMRLERTESTVNLENQLIRRIKLIVWPQKKIS